MFQDTDIFTAALGICWKAVFYVNECDVVNENEHNRKSPCLHAMFKVRL
jgi:hypothetical protein